MHTKITIIMAAVALGLIGTASGWLFLGEPSHPSEDDKPMHATTTTPYPLELQQQLQKALHDKGPDYQPRTKHLLPDGSPKYTNRLILEDSPYLLQHAHNPVDWHPWSEETFTKAQREKKPIFLSIGYSTCHWCHVMEEECFENEAIAQLLNRYFIPLKVDRERRPDVDATYMTAVALTTGGGGWPMSSFLTPDGKTFFAGTYFPPGPFSQILEQVADLWETRQEELANQAERIAAAVRQVMSSSGKAKKVGTEAIRRATSELLLLHEELYSIFGKAPKFPNEPLLFLLLSQAERERNSEALRALEESLDIMARGGIYDQVGGGFHRYATDPDWLIPHFEKMLYNQAHLARLYLRTWRLTGNPAYERTGRQILDYVLRDMRSPEGGFYSATDADSEGREGAFFLWDLEQLRETLSPEDAELAIELFGITPEGNFEESNILHLPKGLETYAEEKGIPLYRLLERIDAIRLQLYEQRKQRPHPLRDEKIITAWNGMMITALAEGATLLAEPRYLEAAVGAAEFLTRQHKATAGKGLWRSHLDGSASVAANQEDYAYYGEALVQLYDATGNQAWLEQAQQVADRMLELFWDPKGGGFFMNAGNGPLDTMARPKESSDNATPSGNSVALRALAMLARRTGNNSYRDKSNAILAAFSAQIESNPTGYAYMLMALGELLHGETGQVQHAANGNLRASARLHAANPGSATLNLELNIRPGWHINAAQPLQTDLIPTLLSIPDKGRPWRLERVEYPKPELKRLGFQEEHLALYQGQTVLTATVTHPTENHSNLPPLQLNLQACNDRICLAPETLELYTPPLLQ